MRKSSRKRSPGCTTTESEQHHIFSFSPPFGFMRRSCHSDGLRDGNEPRDDSPVPEKVVLAPAGRPDRGKTVVMLMKRTVCQVFERTAAHVLQSSKMFFAVQSFSYVG